MSEIVSVGTSEGVMWVPVVKESRQEPQQIALDKAIIGPIEKMSKAVKEAIAISRHTNNAKSFSRDVIADVVQVACVNGWARVGSLTDSAIVGPQEGPFVCQKPRSCITARQTSTCGD